MSEYDPGAFEPFVVAPVWVKDRGEAPSPNGFTTYTTALAIAEGLRARGVPCVIRRGDVVYRDGFSTLTEAVDEV